MPATHPAVKARHRWLALLILLACIDVITVSAMLTRNQLLTEVSGEVVADSRAWAERVANVSTLRQLAGKLATLGDHAIVAPEMASENARLARATVEFTEWAGKVRADYASVEPTYRAQLESSLDAAVELAKRMTPEASSVLEYSRVGQFDSATRAAATMARTAAEISTRLSEVELELQAVHEEGLAAQRDASASLRRADLLIAGINLVLIVAGVVYATSAAFSIEQPETDSEGALTVRVGDIATARPPAPAPAPAPAAPPPEPTAATGELTIVSIDATQGNLDDFPSEVDMPSQRRAG